MAIKAKTQCNLGIERTTGPGRKIGLDILFTSLINRVEAENTTGEKAGSLFRNAIRLQDEFAGLNNNDIVKVQQALQSGDDAKFSMRELAGVDMRQQPYPSVPEAIFTRAALLANRLETESVASLERELSGKASKMWLREIDRLWTNVEKNLKDTGFDHVRRKYPQIFTSEMRLILTERQNLSSSTARAMLKQDPANIGKKSLQIYFTLINVLARLNGKTREEIDKSIGFARDVDTFVGGEIGIFPPLIQIGNDIMPVLEQHPMQILDAANNGLGKQIALAKVFYREFGATGRKGLRQLREQYFIQGGNPVDFDNMVKSYVGQPLRAPIWNPRSKLRRILEYIVLPSISEPLLSLSGVIQIGQTAINSFRYGGKFAFNWFRAIASLGAEITRAGSLKETIEYLRSLNAFTSEVFDRWRVEGSFIEDYGKIIRGIASRVTLRKPIIQLNDIIAGRGGIIFAESITGAKSLSEKDIQTLQFLQFSDKEIVSIRNNPLTGKNDPRFREIVRRFRKFTQFTGLRGPEKTRFLISPVARNIFQFNNFLVGQTQTLLVHSRIVQNAWQRSKATGSFKPLMSSINGFAGLFAGALAAGEITIFIRAAFKGKPTDRENEEIFQRLWHDLSESLFLGPVHRVHDAFRWTDSIYAVPYAFIPSASYVIDLYKIGRGEGPYADLSFAERWQKYIEVHTPATKTGYAVAAMLGLYKDDKILREAVSRSYRFRRDEDFIDDDIDFSIKGYNETRAHIRKAIALMQRGVNPADAINKAVFAKYNEILEQARKGQVDFSKLSLQEAKRRVAQSLEFRRPFKKIPPTELPKLAEKIGNRYYSALYAYDSLISAYIEYLK